MRISSRDIALINHIQAIDFDPKKPITFTGISIDSRQMQRGNLFVAIRGASYDGHDFVTKAVNAGATAVVLEKRWADMNEAFLLSLPVPRLVVENTVLALGELARIHRRKFSIPVLAIGGSNGKTTTKEMLKAVLGSKYSVLTTEGNLNNQLGVPLTLFQLENKHLLAVIEVGTNHHGEIRYLCDILEPTHGLITNIGHEHLEFFLNLNGVARAEGELFEWLKSRRPKESVAFINADDRYLARHLKAHKRVYSFGFRSKNATAQGSKEVVDEKGCYRFTVKPKGKKGFEIALNVPGFHNAQNALAAAAVGLAFEVPVSKIQTALAGFRPTGKRMEVLTIDGVTILNDTYNSNPDSVRAALRTLQSIKAGGKRIAVLSDMLELGGKAEQEHRSVAKDVSRSKVEYLLTYGPLSRLTMEAAQVKFKVHYEQKNILSEYLIELVGPGDLVLIKGSRGMKMEDVVTFLKERLSKAA